jgi:hypothetical protein
MTILEFLYDKFIHLDDDAVAKHRMNVTKYLPSMSTVAIVNEGNDPVIWGNEDNGFWTAHATESRFYENDGTIHILGVVRDATWYEIYNELYRASLNNAPCRICTPVEVRTQKLDIANHVSGRSEGSDLFYIQLTTPTGKYGIPMALETLKEDLTIVFPDKEFFDQIYWILDTLKQHNRPFPEFQPYDMSDLHGLKDELGRFLAVLPIFNQTPTTSVNLLLGIATPILLDENNNLFLEYMRNKCLLLTN